MGIIETIFRAKAEAASDAYAEYIGQSYRPGSGTEGMAFDDLWCDHCTRDAEFRKDWDNADPAIGCQILTATLVYDVTDTKYPKEWVYGHDGRPCCTAFTTDPNKSLRCDQTLDLFEPPAP